MNTVFDNLCKRVSLFREYVNKNIMFTFSAGQVDCTASYGYYENEESYVSVLEVESESMEYCLTRLDKLSIEFLKDIMNSIEEKAMIEDVDLLPDCVYWYSGCENKAIEVTVDARGDVYNLLRRYVLSNLRKGNRCYVDKGEAK